MHKDIARQFDISVHDLTTVHAVGTVPADLLAARIQPFIAQFPSDVQEGSTFQLVLIDVEFHNAMSSMAHETVRRVKLFPLTISRKALLAMLGLEARCRYVRNACLVWHNGDPAHRRTKALMNLLHGDYIKIAVPPGRGQLRPHYTREVAQCLRRGYMPSNVPAVLEAHPEGLPVADMPVIDNFNYIPRAADLGYDRDAMSLMQLEGWSIPAFDRWPPFLKRAGTCRPYECKVGDEDLREPEFLQVTDETAPGEGRPELHFGDITNFLQDLLPLWRTYAAIEQEEEGNVLYVHTWYTDHHRHPRCDEDRAVRLTGDPWRWPDSIAERWDDRIDPDQVIDLYLVTPSPRRRSWEDADAVPHIIVVQNPRAEWRSIHVTAIDTASESAPLNSFVLASPHSLRKVFFLEIMNILDARLVESLIDCMVWHGDFVFDHETVFRARHGDSFLVILNHLRDIVTRAAAASTASSSTALTLLQTGSTRKRIDLDNLIEEPGHAPLVGSTALRVVWALGPEPHPQFIEVPCDATDREEQDELLLWGNTCEVVICKERDAVVCLQPVGVGDPGQQHYVIVNLDVIDEEAVFLHTSPTTLTEHGLMQHLLALGYGRAVIYNIDKVKENVHKVSFKNQQVAMHHPQRKQKAQAEWPPLQHGPKGQQSFYEGPAEHSSDQVIDLGITHQDIQALFASHEGVLQPAFEGLDLPEEIQHALASCDAEIPEEALDRIIIYADGSSLGALKHIPPLRAEEEGRGDTWAYVVVGERYDPPGLKFLGWTAQAVHYDTTSKMHIGATRLSADVAEKEGLAWAALWRLSRNWSIATCFRSDSSTALGQAEGTVGTGGCEETFSFMRGLFQAVEAALDPQEVLYAHVPGHTGEVWNELCDWLAKRERVKSFYCPRPQLDVQKWRKAIGHAWMIFNHRPDLPALCRDGLHAPAPDLPAAARVCKPVAPRSSRTSKAQFCISACTANVNSLSTQPGGHAGKVGYLRQQVRALHLNFVGMQESKTEEICTCVDQIYRLASGCVQHQQGVELWINLSQPYGTIGKKKCYFERGDFQVAHKDPRILLVRADALYWSGWIVVAYAPPSGIGRQEREAWWSHFTEVTHRRPRHEPIIVMIDANASPGPYDGVHVSKHGLPSSSSTPFFREFVAGHELFLPCTTEAHEGTIHTWTDPSGRSSYCIDYVLLSANFKDACRISKVVEEFDNALSDHEATAVEIAWQEWVHIAPQREEGVAKFDAAMISSAAVQRVLQLYQPAHWHHDIEGHIEHFNQTVLHGLQRECPPPTQEAKKPYIDDELWHLRQGKIQGKKRLRELTKRDRDETLLCCFAAWKQRKHGGTLPSSDLYQQYSIFLRVAKVKLAADYYNKTCTLRSRLKRNKQQLLRQRIDQLPQGASASQILHELKPILGPSNLRKLKVRTLPHVRKENGEVCTLPSEAIETWMTFFSTMEGGVRLDLETQREIWIRNLQNFQQSAFHIDANEFPRLLDLEAAYRRVNPHKATGPDRIHPRFCCAAPHKLARKMYGALLKLTTHGQEALEHKGGLLQPVWKAKGAKDSCTSYLSILISSHIGKSLHRSIRQHQTTLFTSYLQREQIGGRPRAPVTLGVHIGRAFLRGRKGRGHNVSMLYLDLTEAFYRILRPLIVGGDINDELILYVGARLGMSSDLLEDLHRHLAEPPAIVRAGLPEHLCNTLRALHEDTHFHVQGQFDRCRTTLGSRPGDCFADVIFSYLWSGILTKLQDQLKALGFGENIPCHEGILVSEQSWPEDAPSVDFLGPTWMDDTCICLSDADPFVLEQKTTQAAGALLALCESHGLTPNLSAGKTEVLMVFQGRKSRQMKLKYFGPDGVNGITVVGEMGMKQIRVVSHYTHLGCVLHHKSDNRREAKRRIGIAQQAFSQHRRHLLQNGLLCQARRIELFKSLIMSKFSYGTESWTFEDCKSKEYVHNALMRLLKRLLRAGHADHLRDVDILVGTGMNSPTEILRIARLRYLGTLYRCKDLVPWGVLNGDSAWCSLVADDLKWMWQQQRDASHLPDPEESLGIWQDLWIHHPSYWKRLVRRSGEHAILQRQREHRVDVFHEGFRKSFIQVHPAIFAEREEQSEGDACDETFACMQCRRVFLSKGGLGAHLFKKHGVFAKVRLLFAGTNCGACLREFHTHSKLQAHLRYSTRCQQKLWGRRRYNAPVSGTGSTCDQQLCLHHDGILPPIQGAGPLLPDGPLEAIPEHDLELAEKIYLALVECEDKFLVEHTVRECTSSQAISWHTLKATLHYMIEEMTTEDVAVLNFEDFDVKAIMRELTLEKAWDFLQDTAHKKMTANHVERREACERACLEGVDLAGDRGLLWPVPRPMGKERYVIHAFSGRRRAGDFQHFVDKAQQEFPETLIYTISLDIMVNSEWGDISKKDVREFWLGAVKERYVVGAFAGPPCETWSKARGRQADEPETMVEKRGPRILREADSLWGRASLALREVRQLDTGNLLLLFTLELLITLALEGGIGGMEHPAPPEEQDKASVWRLPVIEFLMAWPEFNFVEVSQGLWGAPSRKPTGLLLLNMQHMIVQLRSWQTATENPRGVSIGKTKDGFWATSFLKEYPPAFCAGLAGGFVQTLREHPIDFTVTPAENFRRLAQDMIVSDMGHFAGPDFAT